MSRYLVTAALPYANGPVHIGHLAGCYIPADIYVRYLRMKGEDVKFICGSDEHGVPITIKAKNEGISPQQVVDKYNTMMKNSFAEFGISFDIYSRTSNKIHHETAQEFFKNLYDKGVFEEIISEQFYDEEAKQFLADRYIVGTCPRCGFENAYGDQCENCGSSLQPTDLINPKSKLSGAKPVMKQTKNWYLPMGKIQESAAFQQYIKRFDSWKPNIKGQCDSWLKEGLQPRAMTRDLDWGVPVPLPDAAGKVLYVWFDAPIGYISATKELVGDDWKKYWCDENSKLIHFIGKDNIVFHAIIFPMMLLQHGEFVLPTNVPANEFLNLEGDKISTSRNWAVWLHEYLKDFPGKEDVLRYVLTSIAPETKDSDFSWKDFQARNNNELVAILGNFVNRTLVLTQKFYNGVVPQHGEATASDKACIEEMKNAPLRIGKLIEKFKFREAQSEMINFARVGNKYLAENEPWKLIKTDADRVKTIMYVSLEITAYLAVLCEPFLPNSSAKIYWMLNLPKMNWDQAKGKILKPGHQLGEAKLLFEKIEDDVIEKQIQKLHATKNMNEETKSSIENSQSEIVIKSETSFDEFSKMDLRIATILEAERVPKTDKLLKLKIDLGFEQRTIVSGIAHCYEPEKIIGQQVTIIANLAPRKIKGIESKGMILMAEDSDGKLKFVMPSETISNGSSVK
ncbi:MAG: methionine--tRNA ligase [Bacteroidota bacterium]